MTLGFFKTMRALALSTVLAVASVCVPAYAAGVPAGSIDAGNPVIGCQYLASGPATATGNTTFNVQCDANGNVKTTGGGTGSAGAILSSGSDATSNSTSSQAVSGFNYWYNGTTWDRATGSTANGGYFTIKQGGSVLGTSNALPSSVTNGAGTTAAVSAPSADGAAAANGLVSNSQNLVYNGATWDRWSGRVGGYTAQVSVTPTVTSASAYAAGNEVGGLLTFANAFRSVSLSGVVQSLHLQSKSVQTAGFKLYLFRSNPTATTWADKTTPAINATDIPNLIGVYTLANPDSGLGTVTIYNTDGIGKSVQAATTTLYGVLVTTGTPTFTSTTDLNVVETSGQD